MTTKSIEKFGKILFAALLLILFAGTELFAGAKKEEAAPSNPPVTILIAAAASLRNACEEEIIPQFQAKYPWITVEGTFDSSGRLQTQIEQGLAADVFMSAATTQMDNLVKSGHIAAEAVKPLLENKIVLIKTAGASTAVTGFQNITAAKMIALGDPASVPAGQYAQEIFTSLGIWDAVKTGASLGTNVTEVLNWVGAASAEVGVVYATDAASTGNVEI
ncbi:MAG: molybdate ABC transporter substrate-binding protein, partial [Treponema sp.]|nr:molybdate ABC transporter substrate-binding protein [Treponema sp.]